MMDDVQRPSLSYTKKASASLQEASLDCQLDIKDINGLDQTIQNQNIVDGAQVAERQFSLFPKNFLDELGQTIDGLDNFDKITIRLSLCSSSSSTTTGFFRNHQELEQKGEVVVENEVGERLQALNSSKGGNDNNKNNKTFLSSKKLEIILSKIYVEVESEKHNKDKKLLDVEVLLDGFSQMNRSDSKFRFDLHQELLYSELDKKDDDDDEEKKEVKQGFFNTLALGGTFDHLHSGHKILLTMAGWLTIDTLIVGVTDDVLLKTKKYSNRLESIEQRKKSVQEFMERVGPKDLKKRILTIQDIYGPTAIESNIDGILVTRETISGADSIDQIRLKNDLKPLKRYIIDVISSNDSLTNHLSFLNNSNQLKDLKISSTQIRQWINELDQS